MSRPETEKKIQRCQTCGVFLTQDQSGYCSWYCQIFRHARGMFISGLIIYILAETIFFSWWFSAIGTLLLGTVLVHHFLLLPLLCLSMDRLCPQCEIVIVKCPLEQDSCPLCGQTPLLYALNLER